MTSSRANSCRSSAPTALTAFTAVALFSLFPVLSLLASNAGQLDATAASRSAAVVVVGSLLLLAFARLVLHDWSRAALLIVGILLLFFSYGHVYDLVRHAAIGDVLVGRHRFLAPLWSVVGVVWLWVVVRKGSRSSLNGLLALGALLAVIPALSLVVWGVSAARASEPRSIAQEAAPAAPPSEALPDIYYIVLDAYGRSDVLQELYGIDNQEFLAALREQGFYVADQARSNYSQTLASVASSLNMTYLDDLAARMGALSTDRAPLIELIQHSAVRQTLEDLGYQTVAFETGHLPTELRDADVYYSPPYSELDLTPSSTGALPISEFEGLLAGTTALRPLLDDLERRQDLSVQILSFPYQKHRMRVIYTLQTVPIAARLDGPQFVFAHVVCPHPPFIFNQLGEDFIPSGAFTMQDGGCCTRDKYLQGYAGQLPSVNALVLEMVKEILAESDTEPVIIVQGDHGPAAYLDSAQPMNSNMRERLSILSAYHLPGGAESLLYPSITPVNTFGIVFEAVLGQAATRLPDESYFAPGRMPYDFHLVTSRVVSP